MRNPREKARRGGVLERNPGEESRRENQERVQQSNPVEEPWKLTQERNPKQKARRGG